MFQRICFLTYSVKSDMNWIGALLIFSECGEPVGKDEVKNYFPKISRKGSGDDVFIVGLINAELTASQLNEIRLRGKIIKAKSKLDQAQREHQSALEKNYVGAFIGNNAASTMQPSHNGHRKEQPLPIIAKTLL